VLRTGYDISVNIYHRQGSNGYISYTDTRTDNLVIYTHD